jgi:hypothetical protein
VREDVATELVGAEQVQPARRLHHGVEVVLLGVERRQPVGKPAGREHDQHDHQADRAERLAAAEVERGIERRALARQRLVGQRGDGTWVGGDDGHAAAPPHEKRIRGSSQA